MAINSSKTGGRIRRTQRIFASGTFTVPANVYELDVLCIGGGGGGGGLYNTSATAQTLAGGGGGGGWPFRRRIAVTPGAVITAAIGAGGFTQLSANSFCGSDGSPTRFGDLIAPGGGGGGGALYTTGITPYPGASSWMAAGASGGSNGGGGGGGYSGGGGGGTTATTAQYRYSAGGSFGSYGYPGLGGSGGGGALHLMANTASNGNPGGVVQYGSTVSFAPVGGAGLPAIEPSEYGRGGDGGAPGVPVPPASGAANTGNGGIGAYFNATAQNTFYTGGNGGSGLIVVTWEDVA